MQDLEQLLDRPRNFQSQTKTTRPQEDSSKRAALMAEMWTALLSMKLVHSLVGSTEHRFWIEGISDLSSQEIRNGLRKVRDYDGFFTMPAFRNLCRLTPEDFGLPTTLDAFNEVYRTNYGSFAPLSHPAIYQAMRDCTVWQLSHLESSAAHDLFGYHYAVACRRVMAGEDLSAAVPVAIPEKITPVLTPEEEAEQRERGKQTLARLKGML